jgi:hypothetical protein
MNIDKYSKEEDMWADSIILKDKFETAMLKLRDKEFNAHSVVEELHIIQEILKKIYNTLLLYSIGSDLTQSFEEFRAKFKAMNLDIEKVHMLSIRDSNSKKEILKILSKYSGIIEGFASKKAIINRTFGNIEIPLGDMKQLKQ